VGQTRPSTSGITTEAIDAQKGHSAPGARPLSPPVSACWRRPASWQSAVPQQGARTFGLHQHTSYCPLQVIWKSAPAAVNVDASPGAVDETPTENPVPVSHPSTPKKSVPSTTSVPAAT
jgi:hypothetical protein